MDIKRESEIISELDGSLEWYKKMPELRVELKGRINALLWTLGFSEEGSQSWWQRALPKDQEMKH